MGWGKFCRVKPISWQGRERVMGNSLSTMLSHCSSMVAIPNPARPASELPASSGSPLPLLGADFATSPAACPPSS